MTVRGYLRVSTSEQAESGAGLAAQRRAIEQEAERRGWADVRWYVEEGRSGKDLNRPQMVRLLADVRRDDVVVVSKLDRLSRSLVDFAGLMETARKRGWSVIALDLGVDMTTPTGRMVAGIMANLAEWERALISERTRDAMQAQKHAGVRFGHRSRLPAEVQQRIADDHAGGVSLSEIARRLTREKTPTAFGGAWYSSTVRSVLNSRANDRIAGLA